MVQFVGLARWIRLRRNEVIFGGLLSSPKALFQRNQQAIADFQLAQGKREMSTQVLEEPSPICWTAPSPEWVKANWDAALSHQRNRMGLAIIWER